jgi:FO synthase
MHVVGRIALRRYIDSTAPLHRRRAGLVGQDGPRRVQGLPERRLQRPRGTLMNENILRAAGASHGQEMLPTELEAKIEEIGRTPRHRTTL